MREELRHQLRRRRTQVVLAAMLVIPIFLASVLALRGAPRIEPGATPDLQALAGTSSLAFTAYVLYMCAPLLLVVVAALFAGESIAGESAWGTLRYGLVSAAPRHRVLLRAALGALALTLLATAVLVLTSLGAGVVAFGWGPLDTPLGGSIEPGAALGRVALAIGSIILGLLPFLALGLLCSTLVDSPLGAVAGAVGVALVSQILDVFTALGQARDLLPTHYAYGWTDLFIDPPDHADVAAGALQAVIYTVVFAALAWWRFARRDITS